MNGLRKQISVSFGLDEPYGVRTFSEREKK